MLKALLTVEIAPVAAVRFFDPARLMLRLLKVAMPLPLVVWLVVPLSTPVPVDSVIAIETPETVLVNASTARTVMAGEIATPAVASLGCWTKLRLATPAAAIVNELLVAEVRPLLDAVNCFDPTRSTLRLLNVAIPLAFVDWVVPPL